MSKTIVVVDNDEYLLPGNELAVITFEQYLSDYPKLNEPRIRIINLCDTEHYLSRGYYCSLLAEARQHRVLPSVSTINDLRDSTGDVAVAPVSLSLSREVVTELQQGQSANLLVFFGWVAQDRWKKLAKKLFDQYPAPILHISISRDGNGLQLAVKRYAFAQLDNEQREEFLTQLQLFTESVWHKPVARRRHRWDMAILFNPEEQCPPSDKEAIKKFIKAASKVGINAETISAQQASQIAQYDALFIRETTAIDHHTYRLSRKAEQEGLVVIDDSTSILRCCNKVFLHDAFSYKGVPSLKTRVVIGYSEQELDDIEQHFRYPLVLKMPEGSFSKGVFKVESRETLRNKLQELLENTAVILLQEYLYTDFDWRIGVLNGRAIYACRYYMARNHWQIYNHDARRYASGDFDTLPTFEVPRIVLDAAIKASVMIGNGLYGVDIKQKDNHVYVIEVNDNPSIEHNIEDKYLGDELYMIIMSEFANRLERRGRS